jgi:predicted Na+-dependent transporter
MAFHVSTTLYKTPARALAWLGRQGTGVIAALVFVGIAVPPLGAVLKPFVGEAVFVLLCIAFLRVDTVALRGYLGRPAIVLAATAWTAVGVPILVGAAGHLVGLDTRSGDLMLGLMLQAATSPMMASPAIAALMGLDATLVLITLVVSTALVPFTAPLFIHLFTGPVLTLSPLLLGQKLFAILAGAALVGLGLRWLAGAERIERHGEEINGLNVVMLFVFVAAVMENVGAEFLSTPMAMIVLTAVAFAVFFALFGITTLLFMRAGKERAVALGLMTAQRNMGLMVAATGGLLPDLTWLYIALSQFPIYLAPQMLKPLVRRTSSRATV